MSDEDKGNATTQTLYQLATEPVFAFDQNLRDDGNISWEISGEPENIPAPEEEIATPPQDIPEEKEESVEENEIDSPDEEEEEKPKKKNRISEKKRISDLTRQLKQAQSVAHDVLTRNQYLETKLSEKQKEALAQEENLLTSQKERVKTYLTDALEEGDPAKIAEAHDLLSQYNAELRLINSRKNAQPIHQEQNYTNPAPAQNNYQTDYDYPQDVGLEWIESNPWADKNSDEFDQTLHDEADSFSIKLAKKYTLAGRKNEIGSQQFFNDITNYMHSAYEIGEAAEPPKQQQKGRIQMKTANTSKIVPVTRQSTPGEPSRKSNDIVLTPEQKETAHKLRGFVKDPKTGQPITDNRVLEEIYKRNIRR